MSGRDLFCNVTDSQMALVSLGRFEDSVPDTVNFQTSDKVAALSSVKPPAMKSMFSRPLLWTRISLPPAAPHLGVGEGSPETVTWDQN